MGRIVLITAFFFLGLFVSTALSQERADQPSVGEQLQAATDRATSNDYALRYQFTPDEVHCSRVTHLVTIETRINGTAQTAQTRSISVKNWRIVSVDERGAITLVNSIDSVNMWQQGSGQVAITYNSETDEEPPLVYQKVAESVGIPISTITISQQGKIISRDDHLEQSGGDMGGLTIPLPEGRVEVGHVWTDPTQIRVPLRDGRVRLIRVRQRYELMDVSTGVATIDVRTELLTPLNDPWIEAQLVQRMQNGTVRFDIDAGRLISRQMDMDETVIGFRGEDSTMNYLARFTEEPLSTEEETEPRTAQREVGTQPASETAEPTQGPAQER